MYILGLSLGILSTACLSKDGIILSAISQERFSRVKNDESYPLDAINYVMKSTAIDPSEISKVVIAGFELNLSTHLMKKYSSWSIADHYQMMNLYWKPKLIEKKQIDYNKLFKHKIVKDQYPGIQKWNNFLKKINNKYNDKNNEKIYKKFIHKLISDHLGISDNNIIHLDHHLCHASYAYWASPIRDKKTLIMTADAFGDGKSSTIYEIDKNNKLSIKHSLKANDFQLGRIYRSITLLLAMMPDAHEFKIMGLAPHSKSKYTNQVLKIFENTMYVDGINFKYKEKPSDLFFYFQKKFEGIRFDAIAGGLQAYTEKIMLEYTRNAMKKFKKNKLVLSGGISMNVKANMNISNLKEIKDIFIPPSGGDESLAIGACYGYYNSLSKKIINKPLKNAYLGYTIDKDEVNKCLKKAEKLNFYIKKSNNKIIAHHLAKGKVVARCIGRSEFGSRALGNRSILADPRNYNIVYKINEKIKNRDFWMPFAPSILKEYASSYLSNPKKLNSPYMTIAFESTKRGFDNISAGSHQADKTMRPQMVTKQNNDDYYDLIKKFYYLTGVPSILNTSFNLHGFPIVNNASDALLVFKSSDIDILYFDGYMISKIKL